MYIKSLTAENFRNYTRQELLLSPETNVFFGNNAQGKTNILEACYLFSHGRSHRAKSDTELIKFGERLFTLNAVFRDSVREYNALMRINTEGKKLIKINNVPVTKLSHLMSYLNVVMFAPDDLELVKGSPSVRRRFMDEAISQLYPNYLVNLINYNKTLVQKNALLKNLRLSGVKNDPTLSVWNEQLSGYGAVVQKYRHEFLKKTAGFAKEIHKEITKENFNLYYTPSINCDIIEDIKKEFFEKLESAQEREIDSGLSQYGTQRDDFKITINDRDVKIYGSQGQQRTCVLTLKLSETEYIKSIKDEYPVLLLDDIMSELDINRRLYLAEKITGKQVLITCTDADILKTGSAARIFNISNGRITEKEAGYVSSSGE